MATSPWAGEGAPGRKPRPSSVISNETRPRPHVAHLHPGGVGAGVGDHVVQRLFNDSVYAYPELFRESPPLRLLRLLPLQPRLQA